MVWWTSKNVPEDIPRSYTAQFEIYRTIAANSQGNVTENAAIDHHTLSPQDLEIRFNTSLSRGLDGNSASTRLLRNGPNSITLTKPSRAWKLLSFLFGGFTKQLWICFILAALSYRPLGSLNGATPDPTNLGLAGVIFFLIFIQASINLYHDWATRKAFEAFEAIIPTKTQVLRGGVKTLVGNEQLVVGDIIDLRHGYMVPADVRIFEAQSLRLDTSVMDGAPKPITCTNDSTSDNFLESRNMALLGSFVVGGFGRGVVVAVGDRTVMGKLSRAKSLPRTPWRHLSEEMARFMNIISLMSVTFGGLILILWVAWLNPTYPGFMTPASAVTNATSVMVAFVPEGISFGLTLTLAVLARKMVKDRTLIKDLSTVESIGSLSVLAADKTGTLTLKALRVTTVVLDEAYTDMPAHLPSFQQLATILSLCNSASLSNNAQEGDATDIAALKFTESFLERRILLGEYHQVANIPFRSERRWMAALYTPASEDTPFKTTKSILMVKGAPETLLPRCISRGDNQGITFPMENKDRERIRTEVEEQSRQGKRVLIVAYAISLKQGIEVFDPLVAPLVYVGLVAMVDTPRPEAFGMVEVCRGAGIRTLMMTGDHPTTAAAIARQVGILTSDSPEDKHAFERACIDYFDLTVTCSEESVGHSIVLCGEDISTLAPHMWDRLCAYRELVFARTSSTQKLRIVRAFQERGHCVGVVGDGVNDAPSIKHADVGIAMGSSSEVVLQAAHVVLMDNNLSMIPRAVENGRRVFANTDALLYVVPAGSLSETLPIVVNTFLGIPQPLGSLLMTTISVITDLLPSVAVMAEDNSPQLMNQPPRDLHRQPLVRTWPLVRSFFLIGIPDSIMAHTAYFSYMYFVGGITPSQLLFLFNKWTAGYLGRTQTELNNLQYSAQSLFFATLICLQIIKNLLATHTDLRSLPSRLLNYTPNFWYLVTIIGTLVVTALLMYLPLFNTYFNTHPLGFEYWFIALAIAFSGVLLFEFKLVLQKFFPDRFKCQVVQD